MAAELPRPGVEVIQVFQTVSPTVVTPTLVPCVVGVCRQVVDVLTQTATGANVVNSEALVSLQAVALALDAVGDPPVYAGLDGLTLSLSLNYGPPLEIEFAGTPLTPAQVVAQVLLAFSAANIVDFTAETIGLNDAGQPVAWRIRSVAGNEYQTIQTIGTGAYASSPAVLASFGFGPDKVYSGASFFDQHFTSVSVASFPNPNNNLTELVIDATTVRAFLFLGGNGSALLELLQTSAFLQNGLGLPAVETGDVDLTGLTYATAGTTTGSTDITSGALYGVSATLDGLTLIINDDGGGAHTLTFNGATTSASEAAMLAAIEAEWPGLTAVESATHLKLTDLIYGAGSSIIIGAGTANTALGLTPGPYNGTAGTLDGLTLIFTFNGGASPLTVTFGAPPNVAAALVEINAVIAAVALASETTGTHFLAITTNLAGYTASILDGGGTADTALGMVPGTYDGVAGVQALNSGSGSALTTLLQLEGADFTASPTAAQSTGNVVITSVADGLTLTLDDGDEPQTLTFLDATTPTKVIDQINALFGTAGGGNTLATLPGGFLALTNLTLGVTSIMDVVGGTAITALGLTLIEAKGRVRGLPFAPLPGDELWIGGLDYATITQVAPGGNTNQLKISTQVPINPNVGTSWYIVANHLDASHANSGITRPFPNLTVDGTGDIFIQPEVIRNTLGNPVYPSLAQLYIQYEALRLDVSPLATSPGLLTFSNTTELNTQIGPISTANPLALGLYFALLNAPGTQVVGIGIDEYTQGDPYGTVESFTRAATFLEGYEVYGIAPLTHDPTVAQVFQAHVDLMSGPTYRGERIVVVNLLLPTAFNNKLVASGINGNTTPTVNQFDTGVHNLDALLLAQGLTPSGPYAVTDGIFLDDGDGNNYSIVNVVGTVAYLQTSGFLPGQNDDGFYATTDLPQPLISETFSIFIRGHELLLPNGQLDLPDIATTVAAQSSGFNDRRVWATFPDQCAATLNGIEQVLEGFYMNAAIVGMIGQQPPQQSFTNFPMTGFTQVLGPAFSEDQNDQMAGGGTYIIKQDAQGTPLSARMALTTDVTSIETRTDSVTKVVDFVAKFMRTGLNGYIGTFNITQGFLDSLGHVIQGLLGFLTESGIIIGANLNNIVQDTTEVDQVDVDVTLDVPFPCNYIRLTLTI